LFALFKYYKGVNSILFLMAEKQELINLINKLRQEIGLKSYDNAYLQNMDMVELEKLYQGNLALKGSEKTEKPKFNSKIIFIIIGAFVVISLIAGFIFIKPILMPHNPPETTTTISETTTTLEEMITSSTTTIGGESTTTTLEGTTSTTTTSTSTTLL